MPSLHQIASIIKSYFASQPISRAWLFGSYARGEQTPSSDIDILITYDSNYRPGLLGIVRLTQELEELLGTNVDLVEDGTLYPRIRKEVESHKILIYERIR